MKLVSENCSNLTCNFYNLITYEGFGAHFSLYTDALRRVKNKPNTHTTQTLGL